MWSLLLDRAVTGRVWLLTIGRRSFQAGGERGDVENRENRDIARLLCSHSLRVPHDVGAVNDK